MDWGIGHATRCIPIIQHLIEEGHKVTIASAGIAYSLLKTRFPSLSSIEIPGYDIRYLSPNAGVDVAVQTISILSTIKSEHRWLQNFSKSESLDGIISDNRYGLYSSEIPAVLLTHQLSPKFPSIFKRQAEETLHKHLENFKHIWIPDHEGVNALSGCLSKTNNNKLSIEYIGPLSRLAALEAPEMEKFNWLGLVSGPENQRTKFEKLLLNQFQNQEGKCVILSGQPHLSRKEEIGNTTIYSNVSDSQFVHLAASSRSIVARSGYSTIMDLFAMRKTAVLVPTPGQSEQEYLAKYCAEKGWFSSCSQKGLSLNPGDLKSTKNHAFSHNIFQDILNTWVRTL